tara:strand:+ start:1335 stop:1526 length:192 start_codon:yes stop_codon:yes gene_type:complete
MSQSNSSAGIGFPGLLTILFIALKLCGVITWSWVAVFSPIWVTILIFIAIFIVIVAINVIKEL